MESEVPRCEAIQPHKKHSSGIRSSLSEMAEILHVPEYLRSPLTFKKSVDTESDISITQYAINTLRDLIARQPTERRNAFGCFCKRLCKCANNRVEPSENLTLQITTRHHDQDAMNQACMYVNSDNFDGLVDVVMRSPSVVQQRDSDGRTPLHYASIKGNPKILKFLLANKARVNEVDEQGNLPIHFSVTEGQTPAVRLLLSAGADVLYANKNGLQPIHIACERNDTATLKALLEVDGIDVNAEGHRGATPLHYCCSRDSVDCLNLLLQSGAYIYTRDLENTYPIHAAIASISHRCVQALFDHEERINSQRGSNDLGLTDLLAKSDASSVRLSISSTGAANRNVSKDSSPLGGMHKKRRISKTEKQLIHLARTLSRFSKENMLNENRLIELVDSEGETPLHAAVASGNAEMVKICLEKGAHVLAKQSDENTPVHYACIKDDLECVQLMFNARPESKARVLRMPNKNGYTPLHLAAVYNHEKLIEYLVEQGSPLELVDRNNWTPLLLAAMKGSFQACVQLLRLGANPRAHDLYNRNLVHLLMFFQGPGVRTVLPELNDESLFKTLLNERDNYGSTPLHYSTRMGNLGATTAFLLRGASTLERDNERNTPLHTAAHFGRLHTCEKLLDTTHGMRAMNSPDALGRLPIHVAVERGHVGVVKLFLEKGCVFRKCHLGNTPLHYVAIGGNIQACRILLQTNPSLLNQTNFHEMTALHYAAKENRPQIVECLLTSKALITPDKDGLFFVTYALQRRNHEAMQVIISHPRWPEIRGLLDNTAQCPVDGCIRNMPAMCIMIMDRCIKETGSRSSLDHEVVYDFTVLQRPTKPRETTPKDPMRRMKLMVELQRKELLTHPLCTAYLERKWHTYGRWIQLCATSYYATLLAAITTLVLNHSPIRHVETLDKLKPCWGLFYQTQTNMYIASVVASFVLVLTVVDLVAKTWQLLSQRLEYFKDWNNYVEFLLSALAMIYSAMTLAGHMDHHQVGLGVIVMFLAWFNFLLQMMRFSHVGIFVVMFLHVFATVAKCLIVFSVVFIAFALSFHVLFRIPQYKDFLELNRERREQAAFCFGTLGQFAALSEDNLTKADIAIELQPFQYFGLSMFKTLMMMLGEYEHTATVIEPLTGNSPLSVHYPAITLIFYIAFIFLVPIIIMNLLIGLAVGDIEHVRRSAVQQLISQQVYWLADLEPKLMFLFRSRIYQPYWKRKSRKRFKAGVLPGEDSDHGLNDVTLRSNLKEALSRVDGIEKQVALQSTRMAAIIDKLGIKTKEFTIDEGIYPGVLLGEEGFSMDRSMK
ncbi:unnamed protein product [Dicrocoelium dendriticum]|nr:unnamed protein product [Dicrocoelium dendriticum]